jgi:hypothetical protein
MQATFKIENTKTEEGKFRSTYVVVDRLNQFSPELPEHLYRGWLFYEEFVFINEDITPENIFINEEAPIADVQFLLDYFQIKYGQSL